MITPVVKIDGHTLKHLDTGFFIVPDRLAKKLACGELPRFGYERRVFFDTRVAWLQRTPNRYRTDSPKRGWSWAVYAIREAEKKP